MNDLPAPFRSKIEADRLLAAPVISIEDGRKAIKAARRARRECQAMLKPSQGGGRTA